MKNEFFDIVLISTNLFLLLVNLFIVFNLEKLGYLTNSFNRVLKIFKYDSNLKNNNNLSNKLEKLNNLLSFQDFIFNLYDFIKSKFPNSDKLKIKIKYLEELEKFIA